MKSSFLLCALVLLGLLGCKHEAIETGSPQIEAVGVAKPVAAQIAAYVEFTGRTEATNTVDVRSRVTGYLKKVQFEEGAVVTKDESKLFLIDPETFEAEVQRAEAEIARAQAQQVRTKAVLARSKALLPKGAISQEEYDQNVADVAVAEAAVKAATAVTKQSQINLSYTEIYAPITGRISRPLVTEGNLVNANVTILTTIVSEGDMHVYFDVDEQTYLTYKALAAAAAKAAGSRSDQGRGKDLKVLMALANEEGFPHAGKIDFMDNQLDRATGTIHVRALIDDPEHKLVSGLFVRVRVPIGEPKPGLLISERAVQSDQGQKYVWVVDKGGKIAYRKVKLGAWQDGLRAVDEGLTADDQVVVTRVQQVHEEEPVQTQEVPMPVSGVPSQPVTTVETEKALKE
jgi:multidrug efflux system membrane fusion protein